MSLAVGAQVPRRGNAFSRWFGRFVLWAMGWRLEGAIPDLPKMVLIGAPHTSNMDGVLGLAALTALGLRAGTMIKDGAFKGVLGPVLRWFGAIPINRRSPKGVVEQSVDAFNRSERLLLLIAPEGTRHGAAEWKRGFYHIASGAGVPVLPAAADYRRKRITFGPPVVPSGDYAADMHRLLEFYGSYGAPRHPERLSAPMREALRLPAPPPGPQAP
ncbi:MAG: lysophospholipid acyltransferase family protein [Gammaproteobacteria bacterium]|nr:lysophospholipid acyltransferase family protein [Gammaproteobacteria bacterium]